MVEEHVREKKAVALSSVFASLFLTAGKMTVGVMTGSLGIISEAAHSALDMIAALITYFAVRVSDKPADDEHHYGHAKIENLSALIEAGLLFITCAWIIKEAVSRLFLKEVVIEVTVWSYAVIAVSIVVDYSRSRALYRAAKKYNSQALEADALHFSSDILSSLVVLIGLILTQAGFKYPSVAGMARYADPMAALLVACIVIVASWKLARRTVDVLLDKAPCGLDRLIAQEVSEIPGVAGVHKVRLRQAGGSIQGDLHVVIDRNISFVAGHKIADTVEEKLAGYSKDIIVHFEPEDDWEEVNKYIDVAREKVKEILKTNTREYKDYHQLEVTKGHNGTSVSMHLVLPKGKSVQEAKECCDFLEHQIKTELKEANIYFNLEPCKGECCNCKSVCNTED